MTVRTEQATRPRDQLASLSGEVAGIFRRAWGRGPVKTTAYWAGPDMLVVLLENGHTDAEKTLRAAGHIQHLLDGRELLRQIVEDDLTACVERIIGRPVRTTLSATRLDPDLSAELFLLARNDSEDQIEAAERSSMDRASTAVRRSGELEEEMLALAAQAPRQAPD